MLVRTAELNFASLDGTDLRLDLPPDFLTAEEDIESLYDWKTLWFDPIWTGRKLIVVAPSLLAFESAFTDGGLSLDGVPVKPRSIDHHEGLSTLTLDAPKRPSRLALSLSGRSFESGISDRSDEDFFAGKNTVLLKQKNNDLTWVRDFLYFHRKMHGLEAVLLFDNGSTAYSQQDLADAIANSGVERAMIVPAPMRYGTRAKRADGRYNWAGISLEFALLNIARRRFLRRARAVLQCDIDELFWCRGGRSIFDMTARHPLGFVHIPLRWCYCDDPENSRLHVDHRFVRQNPIPAAPKYCIKPSGPLFWADWETHKLRGLGMRPWQMTKRAGAWHMRMLTTNWRPFQSRLEVPDDLVIEPDLVRLLDSVDFGGADQLGLRKVSE